MAGRNRIFRSLNLGLLSVALTGALSVSIDAAEPEGLSLPATGSPAPVRTSSAPKETTGVVPAVHETSGNDWMAHSGVRLTSGVYANPPLAGYPPGPHAPTIVAGPNSNVAYSAADCRPGVPYYGANGAITEHLHTPGGWWDPEGPVEKFLHGMVQNTWCRLEYLQLNIQPPGRVLLGSAVDGVARPDRRLQIVDPTDPTNILTGRVETTAGIDMRNVPGIKFTYGVPLTFGGFEWSIWATDQASRRKTANDLADGRIDFIATSTLINNQPAANVELYDTSFAVDYATQIASTDAIVWFDYPGYAGPIWWRPLFGFQMLRFREKMKQNGVFTGDSGPGLPLNSRINSGTDNILAGFVLGVRAEVNHGDEFSLYIEPKVTFAWNRRNGYVDVRNFRSQNDNRFTRFGDVSKFSPILSITVQGRYKVHENFYINAGYHVWWLADVARASDVIYYNDNGDPPAVPPGVVARDRSRGVVTYGFTLGGEIVFP